MDKEGRLLELIKGTSEGNKTSTDELFNILYRDLKGLAGKIKLGWRKAYTMNTTALVHEAYIKILSSDKLTPQNKLHFYRLCGRAMRYVLQDYLEKKGALKRGGNAELIEIDDPVVQNLEQMEDSEKLNVIVNSLKMLEKEDQMLSDVVECRFFSELTIDETAKVLDISPATVKRKWSFAKAYLSQAINKSA